MTGLLKLRTRLRTRTDSEHEQAALRILIVGVLLAYMTLFHRGGAVAAAEEVVPTIAAILAVAVLIFITICCSPGENVPRRLLGMIADNASATWYMFIASEYGFAMIGVYLFVTFGNGFRYGRRYLFASQALSLAGFLSVIQWAPYWQHHRSAGVGLLLALIILPLYVATLLRRIQEARARAEEANLAKTSFLANMSHEMRTPLNGIVGVVDLFKTTPLSAQQTELVALMRHSIAVLRSLVDDVLDISKIEAGRLTIEVAPFDLHYSINGLIHLLRPHAESKGLSLRAVIDPCLEYRLKGDSHHLRQILLNLLGNAIKFTERGEVRLAVNLIQETEQGITARFEVTDTGIGIAPEALPNIFERFVQADQSTTRKYGGTGLGTTIAKQLAELMGGNIGVQSTLGEGSTFWVELPLLRDVPLETNVEQQPPDVETPPAGNAVSLVLAGSGTRQVTTALRQIGEPYEVVTPLTPIEVQFEKMIAHGVRPRSIIATCGIDQACSVFTLAAQRFSAQPIALVYVANGELPLLDKVRVNSIKGAFALDYATPRLLANVFHAATAGLDAAPIDSQDLTSVLGRERAYLKILIADDNATNQRIISQLLQSAGHSVVVAADGEEALDLYERESPDIAILDFNMPQRSGVEVVQAIRVMDADSRTPCLILSASVTPEARARAKRAGADEFMGKPFDAAALVQIVDDLALRSERITKRRSSGTVVDITSRAPAASLRRVSLPRAAESTQSPASKRRALGADRSNNVLIDEQRFAQLRDIARDPSFLMELVAGFGEDVEKILEKVRGCGAAGNTNELPDLMHALKGAAVGLGAVRLASLASELESAVHALSSRQLKLNLDAVDRCFAETLAKLKDHSHATDHARL